MAEHLLHYFGTAPVQLQRHAENHDAHVREPERSDEEKVIDQLEMAQLDETLTRDIRKADQIALKLSKHGVQIMTLDKKRTLRRVALLNVLFTVAYDDGFGKYNCAIIENCQGGQCKAHVFQAESRTQADQIMLDVDNLFKQMRRIWALAASTAALTVGTSSFTEKTEEIEKENLEKRVGKARELVKRHMITHGIPGVSIGVTVNGKKVWGQGFGYSNLESSALCSEDTVMRIASISKPITATIAARLVQEGKLDLSKPIQEYIPDFPQKKWNDKPVTITTRQLLCHMGGIRHYEKKNEKKDLEDVSKDKDPEEFLSNKNYPSVTDCLGIFQDDELIAEPGTSFNYTTHGLTLVSAILEKAGGTDFPKLVRQLCHQLELRNTHLDVNKRIIPNRASYYVRKNGLLENCQEVDNSCKWAGGGLLSNVDDLLRLANSYLKCHQSINESFLKRNVLEDFWKGEISTGGDGNTKAALGWMRVDGLKGQEPASSTLWYHTGAAVGASSILLIRPTPQKNSSNVSGICIVILCNLQYTSLYSLALDIEAIFHDFGEQV